MLVKRQSFTDVRQGNIAINIFERYNSIECQPLDYFRQRVRYRFMKMEVSISFMNGEDLNASVQYCNFAIRTKRNCERYGGAEIHLGKKRDRNGGEKKK